jgi:hypothetical protein
MEDIYTSKAKRFIIHNNLNPELLEPLIEALKDCAKQHMIDIYFPKENTNTTKPKLVPPATKPAPQKVDPRAFNPYIG